jgi:hypothetical protein
MCRGMKLEPSTLNPQPSTPKLGYRGMKLEALRVRGLGFRVRGLGFRV